MNTLTADLIQGIHVIDGNYNIPDRLSLYILLASYTNIYVRFNIGRSIGYIDPSIDHMPQTSINSLTVQKKLDEQVQPDTFIPALQTLMGDVRKSLNQLLEMFKFAICTG